MLHTIIVVLFMFFSTQAFAGWIAYEAKIFQVASSLLPQVNSPSGSPDRFAVKVVGGHSFNMSWAMDSIRKILFFC